MYVQRFVVYILQYILLFFFCAFTPFSAISSLLIFAASYCTCHQLGQWSSFFAPLGWRAPRPQGRGFLLNAALIDVSTMITPSWSEMPGIRETCLTSPGLLKQKRSRIALCLVGSWTNWVSSYVPSMLSSLWHIPLLGALELTVRLSQSIPGALKSPATISPALGSLSSSVCSSVRASSKLSRAETVSLFGR